MDYKIGCLFLIINVFVLANLRRVTHCLSRMGKGMNYLAIVLKTIIIHSGHGLFFFFSFPWCIIKIFQSICWGKARKCCPETKGGRNQGFPPSSVKKLCFISLQHCPALLSPRIHQGKCLPGLFTALSLHCTRGIICLLQPSANP